MAFSWTPEINVIYLSQRPICITDGLIHSSWTLHLRENRSSKGTITTFYITSNNNIINSGILFSMFYSTYRQLEQRTVAMVTSSGECDFCLLATLLTFSGYWKFENAVETNIYKRWRRHTFITIYLNYSKNNNIITSILLNPPPLIQVNSSTMKQLSTVYNFMFFKVLKHTCFIII